MRYTYPEIRDVFTVCAEAVAPDETSHKGYIRPRSDGMGKILQNVLTMNDVKFELKPGGISTVSGADVKEIFFDFGQSKAIDTTVNEMAQDLDLPFRVNRLFRRVAHYNPDAERARREQRKAAMDKLKQILTKIEGNIKSSDDGGKYFYFYAPYDKLDEVASAFSDLDMMVFRHVSHFGGHEVTVLRYPATMVPGEEADIINELSDALNLRREMDDRKKDREAYERGNYDVFAKEGIEELKKLVTNIKPARYFDEKEPSHYFLYFTDVDRAYDLMAEFGIWNVKKYTGGAALPIKNMDERTNKIINELKDAIAARAKQDALKQLKEKINGYTPYESDGLRYIYLTFPLNFMAKAQGLLRVLGISAEQHIMRINRNSGKRPDFRSVNSNGMDYFVSSLSGGIPVLGIIEPTAKDSVWNVLYELKDAVTAKAGAKRDMGGRPGV